MHVKQPHIPIAVYAAMLVGGIVLTNVEIRLSDSVVVIPSDGVIIAALVLVPAKPWFAIGVIGICSVLNIRRLRNKKIYATLNGTLNLISGSVVFAIVYSIPGLGIGARALLLSLSSVIVDLLIVVDTALEDGGRIRDELKPSLPYFFPDIVIAYAGGLARR